MPQGTEAANRAAERLLGLYGGDLARALEVLRAQFAVIQARTQLLLTLATITLTITGFSGRHIAESGAFARLAMAGGLAAVLAGVLLMLFGLRVRWLTQFDAGSPVATLAEIIAYRDGKTWRYQLQIGLLALGLGSYVSAVVAYLLQA